MASLVTDNDWWRAFYAETPFELYMRRTDEGELKATIDFLWDRLELTGESRVFDQCCGFGSLSLPIAERGAAVVGVDICARYIESAAQEAQAKGLSCSFFAADAFDFEPPELCDAAFNWWTSFGYCQDDERNQLMLDRAFAALKPGGRFALDYPNMPFVLRSFQDSETMHHETPEGVVTVLRETNMNLTAGLREQRWTYDLPDGTRQVHDTALRIYLPHTLSEMLKSAGFSDIEHCGGVAGEPLSISSPRCISLARKPSS